VSRVCSKNSPGYSPSSDLNYVEEQILYIFYLIGFNESDLYFITIDDIIERIRYTFYYDNKIINTNLGEINPNLSSDMYLKSINKNVISNIRRLWFWMQFAKQVV
jgi:hypothetical protein